MPFTDTALNTAINAVKAAADRISAHTGNPGTTGTNEVTGGSYARQTTTWGSSSSGDTTGSEVTIPIPASTTVSYWGLWTSGGTFYGGFALSSSEVFGSAGNLKLTPTLDAD